MLIFLCYAKEPLSVGRLIDAMAVDLDRGLDSHSARKLRHATSIQKICPGFIEISDRDYRKTVHLAHFSVQEYLESPRLLLHSNIRPFAMNREEGHTHIINSCFMFLLEPTLAIPAKDYPMLYYAAKYWTHHLQDIKEIRDFEHQILCLFQSKDGLFERWTKLQPELKLPNIPFGYEANCLFESRTPLSYAAALGLSWLVQILLDDLGPASLPSLIDSEQKSSEDSSARPSKTQGWALITAAVFGQQHIIQLFLNRRSEVPMSDYYWESALYCAAEHGHESIARLLVDNGVMANRLTGRVTLLHLIQGNNEALVRLLVENSTNTLLFAEREIWSSGTMSRFPVPLEHAVTCRCGSIARFLLDAGFDVNQEDRHGRTPLMIADDKQIIKLLLDRGADIDVQDNRGETALFKATRRHDTDKIRLLLEKGADVHLCDENGRDPLMIAISQNYENIAQTLLNIYEHVDASDNLCETALFKASSCGNKEVVQLLLEKGAGTYLRSLRCLPSTDAKTISGRPKELGKPKCFNALEIAQVHGHMEIVQMILDVVYRDMIRPGSHELPVCKYLPENQKAM